MAFGDILKAFNQSGGQPSAMQPMQSPIGMPPIDDKADKNQKLAMMLYALGGALRGDKDFVQNTMALQQMQEGKKKEEEKKRRYNEMIAKMNPESPLYQFSKMVGSEGIDKIAEAQFELATREQGLTPNEMVKMEEAKVLQKLQIVDGDVTKLTPYEKNIYDNYIKGGSINPFMEALAKQIGGSTATPPPVSKTYTVTSGIYKGDSADDIISNAKNLNPQLTREEVIKNLISQGIIAEG